MKNSQRLIIRGLAGMGTAILGLTSGAVPAHAQNAPLSNLLPEMILREIVLESPPITAPGLPDGFTHLAHFSPFHAQELDNPAVRIVQAFNTQMATQFATFPLGSSTGGLTYVFDQALGTFRRGSTSFGPLFGERALTIGGRKLSMGFNYQHTSYDTFEGRKLGDGSIRFYLPHQDCCTLALTPAVAPGFDLTLVPNGTRLNPPFEGDVIEAALSFEASADTTALFANYGVTTRWDIGVAVPFVAVNLEATVRATVVRLVTAVAPRTHAFDPANPDAPRIVHRKGRASGLGDIVVRTKYQFGRAAGVALAAAVDVRLPTGDEKDLLGTGGVQAKFLLVESSERGRFGQHVSLGYTAAEGRSAGSFSGLTSTRIPDEVNFSGGVEFVTTPRLTLIADIIGRSLLRAGRLDLAARSFEYNAVAGAPGTGCGGIPTGACTTVSFEEFNPRSGNLNLALGTVGFKFNPRGNWLVSGSVLFPVTRAGLRSRLTTIFGVDYAF
jgi:hypothetical protein